MPDLTIVGGTLVSGTGLLVTIPVLADRGGRFSFPIQRSAPPGFDLVTQTLFLDNTLPQFVTFTNAVKAAFGQ